MIRRKRVKDWNKKERYHKYYTEKILRIHLQYANLKYDMPNLRTTIYD